MLYNTWWNTFFRSFSLTITKSLNKLSPLEIGTIVNSPKRRRGMLVGSLSKYCTTNIKHGLHVCPSVAGELLSRCGHQAPGYWAAAPEKCQTSCPMSITRGIGIDEWRRRGRMGHYDIMDHGEWSWSVILQVAILNWLKLTTYIHLPSWTLWHMMQENKL